MAQPKVWKALLPESAATIVVPAFRGKRWLRAVARATTLPSGTTLVLWAPTPLAGWRCSRFSREAGLQIERQYLGFPSLRDARIVVEAAPESLRYFKESLLTAPPVASIPPVLVKLLEIARRHTPSRLLQELAWGRVALGCRM